MLFRVLTGQLPYQGSVRLLGHEVRGLRQAAAAGLLGYLSQRGSIDFAIAVRELAVGPLLAPWPFQRLRADRLHYSRCSTGPRGHNLLGYP